MAQHDFNIANAGGATVRADINNVLAAIQSSSSGTSAPSSTVAGMLWLDTAGGLPYALKIRDGGNNHWLTIGTVDDPGSDKGMEINPSKIKLPSSGGIYESDGSTEILTESSGAVSLKNTTIDSTAIFPAGHVIQTKYAETTTATNVTGTSSGSGTTTGLSVSITPTSTSNKLLLNYVGSVELATHSNPAVSIEIHDGTSVVATQNANWGVYINGDGNEYDNLFRYSFLAQFTPASAGSSITYTVRGWKGGNTVTFQPSSLLSAITIQEIQQ